MTDYPYTTVPGKLRSFFEKVQDVGRPSKVTQQWLSSIGFTSSNDRTVSRVLKFVGFVDGAGAPTSIWSAFRDRQRSGQVMADALKQSYSDLFQTYPDAYQRSDQDLRNFFSTRTDAGAQAIAATVSTFKILCALADFASSPPSESAQSDHVSIEPSTLAVPAMSARRLPDPGTGVTINLNIQIAVPETKDDEVYDKFFAALKRHLIARDE